MSATKTRYEEVVVNPTPKLRCQPWEGVGQVREDVIRAGLLELVDRVLPRRDADTHRVRCVCRGDIHRRVAHDTDPRWIEWGSPHDARAANRDARELAAVVGVGAESAK